VSAGDYGILFQGGALNKDLSIEPVVTGSGIIVEKRGREPLVLNGGNVGIVPGCGWDQGTSKVNGILIPDRKKLEIIVRLVKEIP